MLFCDVNKSQSCSKQNHYFEISLFSLQDLDHLNARNPPEINKLSREHEEYKHVYKSNHESNAKNSKNNGKTVKTKDQ
jgi:hypothetical protein